LEAYEISKFYKEKTKKFHESLIARNEFVVGDKVLLTTPCLVSWAVNFGQSG